jgi:hypothetical protein
MTASIHSQVPRKLQCVFLISLVVAVVGVFVFPFHLPSFAWALAGGAFYAASFVSGRMGKATADGVHFLAIAVGSAFCLLAARSYPQIEPHSSYFTFTAYAIAAAVGSGVGIIIHALRQKRANQSLQPTGPSRRG